MLNTTRQSVLTKIDDNKRNNRCCNQRQFSEKERNFIQQYTHYCPAGTIFRTRLILTYHLKQAEWPVCSVCPNKLPHFRMLTYKRRNFTCSKVCAVYQAGLTCLDRYGVDYSMKNGDVRLKQQQTMVKKHGASHSLQSKEVMPATLPKCVTEYRLQSGDITNKVIDKHEPPKQNHDITATNLPKCVTDYPLQSGDITVNKVIDKHEPLKQNHDITATNLPKCVTDYLDQNNKAMTELATGLNDDWLVDYLIHSSDSDIVKVATVQARVKQWVTDYTTNYRTE